MSQNTQAMAWMLLTGFLSVAINTTARLISEAGYHPFQVVFFYSVLAMACYLPFVLRAPHQYKTSLLQTHIGRSVLEFIGFSLTFAAVIHLPIATFTALSFLAPLLGFGAAIFWLKETGTQHYSKALIVGFCGMLMIVRPGISGFEGAALLVVVASVAFACCSILIKKLTASEPSERIAFYMLGCTALISLPFAGGYWKTPTLSDAPLMIALGVMVALIQFSVAQAFSRAPLTSLLPLFFLNLIWSSLIGILFFHESLDHWTLTGGILILGASYYAARQKTADAPQAIRASSTPSNDRETS